jgi:hypothetical protein
VENYCQYQQRLSVSNKSKLEKVSVWIQCLSRFFGWLGLGDIWHKTFWGLKCRLVELKAKGQQNIALSFLLEALEHRRFWRDHEAKWWSLMRKAVLVAQDLELQNKAESQPLLRLIKLSQNAPQPWQGYDVAYCFASLSLWSFVQGKSSVALDQVKIAQHADPSWAYSEYLLGWYGLWLEGIDPVKHFVRAIHLDWGYLQCLIQDTHCQQFPQVLQAVKQAVFLPR